MQTAITNSEKGIEVYRRDPTLGDPSKQIKCHPKQNTKQKPSKQNRESKKPTQHHPKLQSEQWFYN